MPIEIFSAMQRMETISVKDHLWIVIDVLRASSTILCLMENGAEKVRVIGTVEEALELKHQGYILIGERGDQSLEGFELDNSPYAVSQRQWSGLQVVITTTNGTQALIAVREGYKVVVAGFRNIDAVAQYAVKSGHPLGIIPIGNMGQPRVEDEKCATALRDRILGQFVDWGSIREEILREKSNKIERLGESYRKDVNLSLMPNVTSIVPVMGQDLILYREQPVM